ncbi:MAG: hypothetical protein PVF73_08880 [Bacteroidales bacterium]|jgi:hypothetical protein
MKHIVLLFLSLLIVSFSSLYAQKYTDVVFLKNGSIIKGTIVESDGERVKIETCCGSIFVYRQSKIEKTEKVPVTRDKNMVKEKGYVNYISFGALVGASSNSETAPFSAITEHGYRFNRYFAAGALIGYELLSEATMPLALNLKAYYPVKNTNLFFGLSGGYSFSLEGPGDFMVAYDDFSGGVMTNLEAGIIFPFSGMSAFFVAVGFRYNKINYTRTDPYVGDVDGVVHYKRLSIRVGINLY